MYRVITFIFYVLFIFVSCDSENHIRTYRLPKPDNKSNIEVPEANHTNKFDIGWEKPNQWKEVAGHSMRLASFIAPFSSGEGDVSITTFAGESGGIGPNVNRWLGQIGLANLSDSEIKKMAINKSGNLGQYAYFKLINSENTSAAILAAIFSLNQRTVFVKLSSTFAGINELEQDFQSFCSSIYQE